MYELTVWSVMLRISFKRCLTDDTALGTSSPKLDNEIWPQLIVYSSMRESWYGFGKNKRRLRRSRPGGGKSRVVVHEHKG